MGKSNAGGAMPTTSVLLAIDLDGAADDRGIGGEAALPEAMAEHDAPVLADRFVLGQEHPAGGGLNAHDREEVRRDVEALHVLGLVFADEIGRPPLECREVLEDALLPPHVEEVRRGDGLATIAIVRLAVREQSDPIGVAHREGPQHERVDIREDRRVGSEAEGQRDDDDRARGRAFQDAAAGVAQFESERLHERISRRRVKVGARP